jgi:beta-barrel assembly-enhancing protease
LDLGDDNTAQGSAQPPAKPNFSHSPYRLLAELSAVVALIGALLWGLFSAAQWATSLLVPLVPAEVDRLIGEQAYSQLALTQKMCGNPELARYLAEIHKPLLAVARAEYDFEIVIVESDEVNAFALPGGTLIVNTALVTEAGNGEAIAGVLAHEMAHVTRRHSLKRALRQLGIGALVSMVFGGTGLDMPAAVISGLGSTQYDRSEESEADVVGLEWLAAAGIDSRGLAEFLGKLERQGPQLPTFLSSHPDPGDRVEEIRKRAGSGGPRISLPPPPAVACR